MCRKAHAVYPRIISKSNVFAIENVSELNTDVINKWFAYKPQWVKTVSCAPKTLFEKKQEFSRSALAGRYKKGDVKKLD